MSELNKLREEVQRRKKENEVERKQFEEKMVEMEKIVEGLKSRIKNLESTLRQNEVEYRNDLQKNQVNQYFLAPSGQVRVSTYFRLRYAAYRSVFRAFCT